MLRHSVRFAQCAPSSRPITHSIDKIKIALEPSRMHMMPLSALIAANAPWADPASRCPTYHTRRPKGSSSHTQENVTTWWMTPSTSQAELANPQSCAWRSHLHRGAHALPTYSPTESCIQAYTHHMTTHARAPSECSSRTYSCMRTYLRD